MTRLRQISTLALLGTLFAGGAQAHVLGIANAGFEAGLAHPFSGLDHLLAMVALGIWAAMVGGRTGLALPIAFPVAMVVGGILGAAGVPIPSVEVGIALSVLSLGGLIAAGARLPFWLALTLVSIFAALHGHAHGTELPEAASPVAFGLGMVLATLLLHLTGFSVGTLARRMQQPMLLRAGGVAISMAGLVLLLG